MATLIFPKRVSLLVQNLFCVTWEIQCFLALSVPPKNNDTREQLALAFFDVEIWK